MSTPKGMKCSHHKLTNGDSVLIYSDQERIVLQIPHQTPTEENLLDASFKVAVVLSPTDALLIANELLTIAVPRLTSGKEQKVITTNGEEHRDVQ